VSINWAGYVANGASFSDVRATWTQPAVRCLDPSGRRISSSSGFWIGLGGASFSSAGLEQTGTAADCTGGTAHYDAWYEILPAPETPISFAVHPGDEIFAEVNVADGIAAFTLRNLTTGAAFTHEDPVRFPAVDSAEWIAEAPSACRLDGSCHTLPLSHFGAILFRGASATADAHTGTISDHAWSIDAVRLAARTGSFSARPSDLSADGSSFSVATEGPRVKTPLPDVAGRLPVSLLLPASGS